MAVHVDLGHQRIPGRLEKQRTSDGDRVLVRLTLLGKR